MVSIIMLTHNAPDFVKTSIETLSVTRGAEYELIVLDNASETPTRGLLTELKNSGLITKLIFSQENTFFAKGNNIASEHCSPESKYILLLNSDVEIRDAYWLEKMLKIHKKGATSLGSFFTDGGFLVADGYCFLIDKPLYLNYKMREDYEWWYSLPYLETRLLKDGYEIQVVKSHDDLLVHFGGKSGDDWKNAKGQDNTANLYDLWFSECNKKVTYIFSLTREVGSDISTFDKIYGMYPDGFCAPAAIFNIMTKKRGKIKLNCYSPLEITGLQTVQVCSDGKPVCVSKVLENQFEINIKTNKNTVVRIQMNSNFSFAPPPPDIRPALSFILSGIETE